MNYYLFNPPRCWILELEKKYSIYIIYLVVFSLENKFLVRLRVTTAL